MTKIKTDICVIGAGAGGLSVAAGAVQMGARVVLIESGKMGGDCLNYGCVPSKALLSVAKAVHHAAHPPFGLPVAHSGPAFALARAQVAHAIAEIAPVDSQERFEGLGVQVIRARARFIARNRVVAGDAEITARRFVIATGARAAIPPIEGLAKCPYLTNETIFDLKSCPEHLLILGGGVIGMEMAQAHRRLGAKVTVIEGGQILAREDPEAVDLIRGSLLAEGVVIRDSVTVTKIRKAKGRVVVTLATGEELAGSHLLVATGRKPVMEDLDLDAANIDHNAQGVVVDAGLRSRSNRRVYAIGDVAGKGQLTHLAGYQAGVILRPILFGLPARARADHIPRAIYLDPELAQIGLTEAEARARYGARLSVARAEFAHNDRVIAAGEAQGFTKVMIHRGRPVGVTIYGPEAGELIAPWALAISAGLKISAIAGMVLPYPTRAEINKRAASAYFAPKLFQSPWVKRLVRFVQRF